MFQDFLIRGMNMEKISIKITTEFIKLDQLLKFSGMAESGVEAKAMILDEIVSVNGGICTMRGKKIHPGDVVVIDFDDTPAEITVEG